MGIFVGNLVDGTSGGLRGRLLSCNFDKGLELAARPAAENNSQ